MEGTKGLGFILSAKEPWGLETGLWCGQTGEGQGPDIPSPNGLERPMVDRHWDPPGS